MKKYAILLALATCLTLTAGAQCYRATNQSTSLAFGMDHNGPTETFEMGLWGVDQPFGGDVGFMVYNVSSIYDDRDGKPHAYLNGTLAAHLRLTYKVYHDLDFNTYHLVTTYVTSSGGVGASYRAYKPIGNNFMVGLEPSVSSDRGWNLGLVLTADF